MATTTTDQRPLVGIMALTGTASIEDLRDLGVTGIRVGERAFLDGDRVDRATIERFRVQWQPFVEAGFRLQVITPFPSELGGVDHTTPAWERAWTAIGRDLGDSIGDLVHSWQIGNELNIWQFRAPLRTVPEAVRFVEALGTGLRSSAHRSALGTNTFGIDAGARQLCDGLYGPDATIDLDYIGLDAYFGSWVPGGPANWATAVDESWELGRGRPVVVCEIGYPSRGAISAPGEFEAYLRNLGYAGLASVEGDRSRLLAAAPEPLARHLRTLPTESWADDFEDAGCHLLQKWRNTWGSGSMSPQKQADYFRESLPILMGDSRVSEVWLFIYRDLETCWTCGQTSCPLETSWGFVELDGSRKPVFDAVRNLSTANREPARGG